jgi:hypothetical protein
VIPTDNIDDTDKWFIVFYNMWLTDKQWTDTIIDHMKII